MLIVRYCNKRGQIVDQIVLDYEAFFTYREIKSKFGQADLILVTNECELCIA